MGNLSIGTFARRHRLVLSLIGVMAVSALVLSACEAHGDSSVPNSQQSGSAQQPR
jgi:hypothetical protein